MNDSLESRVRRKSQARFGEGRLEKGRTRHLADRLLYIMEGDVIRTIRDCKEYIGHYHTGGNPGRNEIDDTQELNYTAIMKAILATGFQGYVAQEFIPKRESIASLAQAFTICDV